MARPFQITVRASSLEQPEVHKVEGEATLGRLLHELLKIPALNSIEIKVLSNWEDKRMKISVN